MLTASDRSLVLQRHVNCTVAAFHITLPGIGSGSMCICSQGRGPLTPQAQAGA